MEQNDTGLAATVKDLAERFTYHSQKLSLALTKLEEACFWANASIARHG
jgi:hypothetical protein